MTNENETPAQQRKRVRIDDEVTVLGTTPATITPSLAATKLVSQAVASHPVPIQDFIKQTSQRYNALKSKQRQQELSLVKLKEATFIPRSIRVNVNLTAPESVMETTKFKEHQTNIAAAREIYQTACKKAILGTAELVNEEMKKQIGTMLVTSIVNLASLLILTKRTDGGHHRLAYYITDKYLPDTLFTATWTTKPNVLKLIRDDDTSTMDVEVVYDADDPPATDAAPPTMAWSFTDMTETTLYETLQKAFTNLLTATFVDSWMKQLDIYQSKETEAALAARAKRIMGVTATNTAAQTVTAEPSVGPKVVKQMIDASVNQKFKKVDDKISKLSEKVQRSNPKNSTRGTKKPPAKETKDSSGAPSTKNSNGKGKGKKTDAAGKGKATNKASPKKRGRSPGKSDNDMHNANKSKSPKQGCSPANKNKNTSKRSSSKN
jgi:hypothetical protein